jgi:hypothetical protein
VLFPSSIGKPQATMRTFAKKKCTSVASIFEQDDEPKSESTSELEAAEDIERVEFDREKETEDQENSQDRNMMDDSTQDPVDPLTAYAQIDAELDEGGSEDVFANRVIKRRLPAGGASQAAPPRRRSHQLEASQEPEPGIPPETGTHPSLQGGREPPVDLSQPECDDPPSSGDLEDDDERSVCFESVPQIPIDEVRRISSPQRPLIRLHNRLVVSKDRLLLVLMVREPCDPWFEIPGAAIP